jgi:hypothetical protein
MNPLETSLGYRSETRYFVLDACHIFKDTHPVTVVTFVAYDRVIIELQMYEHLFASWTT